MASRNRWFRFLWFLVCVPVVVCADPPGRSPAAGGWETLSRTFQPVFPATVLYPLLFPIAQEDFLVLSSAFGWRVSPTLRIMAYHDGIDVETVPRAQVVAAADGWVEEYWPPPDGYYRGHPVYGGLVIIAHASGMRTLCAHLSEIYVRGWQEVRAGQVIGRVGATGKVTGEHLHFRLTIGGQLVNPLLYLRLPR